MAKVILSNWQRKQIAELPYASNVTWRKALSSQGYASFDLPLTDQYATPHYLNPGNYVHIFSDTADTTDFANADFGGLLTNDFEVKPKNGVVTLQAAGLAQMLELSIVPNTQSYYNVDVCTVADNLIQTCDNYSRLGLTRGQVDTGGGLVSKFIAGWGDTVYGDLLNLSKQFGYDFEMTPNWVYNIRTRQGEDHPDYIIRYGSQGNVQVDTTMHYVNTEMANQIYYFSQDGSTQVYTANQTSVQFYGPKTLVVYDSNGYTSQDLLTKAQLEVAKRAFPSTLMDHIKIVDTPLLPFNKLVLGDRVTFESPSIPLLQSFNGLQRILAIQYDDKTRTMDLTLGNALYVVLRGKLHEVRLYTSNG